MKKNTEIDLYISSAVADRQDALNKLRNIFIKNLPKGFEERIQYKMISYVVPHSLYPAGYHCTPELPLPFISIASQKNFIALYHMGIYANPNLLDWFVKEYLHYSKQKLDMGKSCIRFKKISEIPYELISSLAGKMSSEEWISLYENSFVKK